MVIAETGVFIVLGRPKLRLDRVHVFVHKDRICSGFNRHLGERRLGAVAPNYCPPYEGSSAKGSFWLRGMNTARNADCPKASRGSSRRERSFPGHVRLQATISVREGAGAIEWASVCPSHAAQFFLASLRRGRRSWLD